MEGLRHLRQNLSAASTARRSTTALLCPATTTTTSEAAKAKAVEQSHAPSTDDCSILSEAPTTSSEAPTTSSPTQTFRLGYNEPPKELFREISPRENSPSEGPSVMSNRHDGQEQWQDARWAERPNACDPMLLQQQQTLEGDAVKMKLIVRGGDKTDPKADPKADPIETILVDSNTIDGTEMEAAVKVHEPTDVVETVEPDDVLESRQLEEGCESLMSLSVSPICSLSVSMLSPISVFALSGDVSDREPWGEARSNGTERYSVVEPMVSVVLPIHQSRVKSHTTKDNTKDQATEAANGTHVLGDVCEVHCSDGHRRHEAFTWSWQDLSSESSEEVSCDDAVSQMSLSRTPREPEARNTSLGEEERRKTECREPFEGPTQDGQCDDKEGVQDAARRAMQDAVATSLRSKRANTFGEDSLGDKLSEEAEQELATHLSDLKNTVRAHQQQRAALRRKQREDHATQQRKKWYSQLPSKEQQHSSTPTNLDPSEAWQEFEERSLTVACQVLRYDDIPFPPNLDILRNASRQNISLNLKRWHPDKFLAKYGGKLHPDDQKCIVTKINEVFQALSNLRR